MSKILKARAKSSFILMQQLVRSYFLIRNTYKLTRQNPSIREIWFILRLAQQPGVTFRFYSQTTVSDVFDLRETLAT